MGGRVALLLICLLLASPWVPSRLLGAAPQSAGNGEIVVYLQPLPPGAERFTFVIANVVAINDRGVESPLDVSLKTVTRASARRQRLLASGPVPAGEFVALAIDIGRAALTRDSQDAALLVPDRIARVVVPFAVGRGRAVVLWLDFRPDGSLTDGVTFTPMFSARVAPRPILNLAGFVSNAQSNSVTAFDKHLGQAAAVIPTGEGPAGLALDRLAGKLYVACEDEDEVQAIDVAGAEVVERARLFAGDGPRELALTPDGRTLLSVNNGSNSIGVFDTAPLTRVDRINVGSGPGAVVIDPTGQRAFVFNTFSSSLSVIDIARRSVVATISVDAGPLRGQFSARGDRLFVVHERSPYVSVVDPQRLTTVTRARLRIGITAIKLDTRRNVIYVGGRDDDMLEFYDPNTLLPVASMPVGGGVSQIAIDGETDTLYLVSPDTGRLVVERAAERKVVSEVDVGKSPYWVAVMGER